MVEQATAPLRVKTWRATLTTSTIWVGLAAAFGSGTPPTPVLLRPGKFASTVVANDAAALTRRVVVAFAGSADRGRFVAAEAVEEWPPVALLAAARSRTLTMVFFGVVAKPAGVCATPMGAAE